MSRRDKWINCKFDLKNVEQSKPKSKPVEETPSVPKKEENESDTKILKKDEFLVPAIPIKKSLENKLINFKFFKHIEPQTVEDLAVHNKKVTEVEEWITHYVLHKKCRKKVPILLLTGPTGCGKTATLRLLCKFLQVELQEWTNPIDYFDHQVNQASRLSEFLMLGKYPSLFSRYKRKLTLVKDFPNQIINNPEEFHKILKKVVADGRKSLAFICTEVGNNKLDIAKKLFPDLIKCQYHIHTISFNSCSATLLKVALKRAQCVVQKNLDIFKLPAASLMDAIVVSTMGDIRCAMNQYYFAALKGTNDMPIDIKKFTAEQKQGQKRERVDKSSTIKSMKKDEPLGLFHSIGRVLNPKRVEEGNSWRLNCELEPLIDEFSTQPSTFNSFLHENYPKYFGDIHDISRAAEILSMSQTLLEIWNDRHSTLIFGLWISVMGLMIHNEHKVTKWTPIKGPKKITKRVDNDIETRKVNVTDYSYYNTILKQDKFPTLTYKKKQ